MHAESGSETAVFICSSDSRRDVLERVLPALAGFWPDCPYPVYVGLNSPFALPGRMRALIAPASEWYRETREQLLQIEARYLILVLDDYLLHAPVKQAQLDGLLETAVLRRLPYLRLVPLGRSLLARIGSRRPAVGIEPIDRGHPFYSSLQIAIWSREHLLAMLDKCCSIWDFEHEQIAGISHYAVIEEGPFTYDHVVEKGKWLPHAASLFARAGLGFGPGHRAVWSRWRYLQLWRDRVSWALLGYSTC